MLLHANFEHLDLSALDKDIREKITLLHNNNESFHACTINRDLTTLKVLLENGYPKNWENALKEFNENEQEILSSYKSTENEYLEWSQSSLKNSFDNNYRNFDKVFYKENFHRETVELLASYYFNRNNFQDFKLKYFALSEDIAKAEGYLKKILKDEESTSCFVGFMFNKNTDFFDLLSKYNPQDTKKGISLLATSHLYFELYVNEESYKKAFDLYIDKFIEKRLHYFKSIISYTEIDAINDIFRDKLKIPNGLKDHVYKKYEDLTGIDYHLTPVALAYHNITRVDLYFEIEWERMSDSFKQKYSKEQKLASSGIRRKNLLDSRVKEFKKVLEENTNHNAEFLLEQYKSIGIPIDYYPQLSRKVILEEKLIKKDTDKSKKI